MVNRYMDWLDLIPSTPGNSRLRPKLDDSGSLLPICFNTSSQKMQLARNHPSSLWWHDVSSKILSNANPIEIKTSKTNGLNLHSNGMAGVELTSENIRELHQGGVLHVEKKDEKPICQKHPVASPFTNHGGQQKSSQMDLWGLFMGHGYTPWISISYIQLSCRVATILSTTPCLAARPWGSPTYLSWPSSHTIAPMPFLGNHRPRKTQGSLWDFLDLPGISSVSPW